MLLKIILALSALVSSGHNLKSHVHCFHPHWHQMYWSSPSHSRHSYLTFPKTSSPPGMCLKWMLSGKTSILKQVKRLKGCQNNAVQSKDVSQAAGIMQNVPGIKDDSFMTPSVPQGGWATFIQQTLLLTQKTERTTKPRLCEKPKRSHHAGRQWAFFPTLEPKSLCKCLNSALFSHEQLSEHYVNLFWNKLFHQRTLCKRQFFLQNPCKNNSPSITNPTFKRPFTITKINQSPFPVAKQRIPLQNTGEIVTPQSIPDSLILLYIFHGNHWDTRMNETKC